MIDAIANLPDFAKDLRLNYSSLEREAALTPQQKLGVLLVSAMACRNFPLARAIAADADFDLDESARNAICAATALMAMNNIYYRFVHSVEHSAYKSMPARLRMNAIANPGVDKADFELWSLAASTLNGCTRCVNAHESALREHGIREDAIQAAVRYAAIVGGVATSIEIAENDPFPSSSSYIT